MTNRAARGRRIATSLGIGVALALLPLGSSTTAETETAQTRAVGPGATSRSPEYDGRAAATWAAAHGNARRPTDASAATFIALALNRGGIKAASSGRATQRNDADASRTLVGDLLNRDRPAVLEPLTMVQNAVTDARPGDLILYVWDGDPAWQQGVDPNIQLAMVTGDSNLTDHYPVVAEWGTLESAKQQRYVDGVRGWTWSQNSGTWLQDLRGHAHMTAVLVHIPA